MHLNGKHADATRRLIVALDFSHTEQARRLVSVLHGEVGVFKIGLELIFAAGLSFARTLADAGCQIFLDAKLLDIPNTVERATANAARLGAAFLTVHASDRKTLDAAVRGRGDSPTKLLAVTVLTSLDEADLASQGIALTPAELVMRRARLARDAGLDGVVASAHEAAAIRAACGNDFLIVTPGIRPAGAGHGDQMRVMTPAEAIAAVPIILSWGGRSPRQQIRAMRRIGSSPRSKPRCRDDRLLSAAGLDSRRSYLAIAGLRSGKGIGSIGTAGARWFCTAADELPHIRAGKADSRIGRPGFGFRRLGGALLGSLAGLRILRNQLSTSLPQPSPEPAAG